MRSYCFRQPTVRLRPFVVPVSRSLPPDAILAATCGPSPTALCSSQCRAFVVVGDRGSSHDNRESRVGPDDLFKTLGLKASTLPTRDELARAFRREALRLARATEDSPLLRSGATSTAELADLEARDAEGATAADGGATSAGNSVLDLGAKSAAPNAPGRVSSTTVPGIHVRGAAAAHAAMRLGKLVEAYRALSNTRHRNLYDAATASDMDVLLGHKRDDGAFGVHDARRQQFFFADPAGGTNGTARSLGDFSQTYRTATGAIAPIQTDGGLMADMAPQRGEPLPITVPLNFVEAFTGCSKRIAVARRRVCVRCGGGGRKRAAARRCGQCYGRGLYELPAGTFAAPVTCTVCGGSGQLSAPDCNQCHGVGSVDPTTPDTLAVPILPGARDGATIVLHGAGHAGMRQGPRGDVIATLAVRPHRVFERDGQDLRIVVPVSLSTALAGGVVRVPALGASGGATSIDVPIPSLDSASFAADASAADAAEPSPDAACEKSHNDGAIAGSIRFLQAARVVPVDGWGMPNAARKRGRLLVQIVAVLPSRTALTRAQRDAMATVDPQFLNTDPNGECVEVAAPTKEMLQEARAAFSFLLPKPLD